jgi:hypothetical protein
MNWGVSMATKGLSLVGFMEKPRAIKYLRDVCAFQGDTSDARLGREWELAKAKLGGAIPNAGNPQIQEMPSAHHEHIARLLSQDWLKRKLDDSLKGATFKLVELSPLLAMQFAVCTERSGDLCNSLSRPPSMEELLTLCLPIAQPHAPINVSANARSLHISSRNLSLRIAKDGVLEPKTDAGTLLHIGVHLDMPVPLLHVVRYQGKCYLHNGFHRAYGAQAAGVTHVPCIFREVDYPEDIGIADDTFQLKELQSSNPPTVGHFVPNRAYEVTLKSLTRVIHVSWAEYSVDSL